MTELVRVSRGLWRPSDSVEELIGRCAAVLTVLPPMTVIGGVTAARLHGLWLPERLDSRMTVLLRNEPLKPRERAGSIRREIRARRVSLRPDEIVLVDGVPVTSETRTWIELAGVLSMPDLVAAGDSVLRGQHADDLDEMLRRARGRRWIRKARAAREFLDGRSRSRPESHLRYALVSNGLPTPEVNRAIYTASGEWLAEPDLHYKRARLALEYNGDEHASKGRMRKDITRTLDILDDDWLTIPFGPVQVFDRPEQCASRVRRYLDLRDPGWWRRPRVAT
jgi:hypothetical protein